MNDWYRMAACRDMNTATFFHVGRTKPELVKACAGCAVRSECLTQALIDDEMNQWAFGYRGGMTAAARLRLRVKT